MKWLVQKYFTKNLNKRVAAFAVLCAFFANTVLYAAPELVQTSLHISAEPAPRLAIPDEYGKIDDQYIPETCARSFSDCPLVVYLQDAHANLGAQQNIQKMVRSISDQLKIKTILMEGASGTANLEAIRSFPDQEVKEQVADFWLREVILTGIEAEAILSHSEYELVGIEDKILYKQNLSEFNRAIKMSKPVVGALNDLIRDRESERDEKDSPALKDFENKIVAYEKKSQLMQLVSYLWNLGREQGVKRADLADTEKLISLIILEKSIESTKQDMSSEKMQFQKLMSEIGAKDLFKELDELKARIRERLYQSQDEKERFEKLSYLKNIAAILSLQATPDDVRFFELHANEITVFSKEMGIEPHVFDPAIVFYRTSSRRERAFLEAVERQVSQKKKTFLVTGGFHTNDLKEQFRRLEIPFVTIAPAISPETNYERYYERLSGEEVKFEKFILKFSEFLESSTILFEPNLFKPGFQEVALEFFRYAQTRGFVTANTQKSELRSSQRRAKWVTFQTLTRKGEEAVLELKQLPVIIAISNPIITRTSGLVHTFITGSELYGLKSDLENDALVVGHLKLGKLINPMRIFAMPDAQVSVDELFALTLRTIPLVAAQPAAYLMLGIQRLLPESPEIGAIEVRVKNRRSELRSQKKTVSNQFKDVNLARKSFVTQTFIDVLNGQTFSMVHEGKVWPEVANIKIERSSGSKTSVVFNNKSEEMGIVSSKKYLNKDKKALQDAMGEEQIVAIDIDSDDSILLLRKTDGGAAIQGEIKLVSVNSEKERINYELEIQTLSDTPVIEATQPLVRNRALRGFFARIRGELGKQERMNLVFERLLTPPMQRAVIDMIKRSVWSGEAVNSFARFLISLSSSKYDQESQTLAIELLNGVQNTVIKMAQESLNDPYLRVVIKGFFLQYVTHLYQTIRSVRRAKYNELKKKDDANTDIPEEPLDYAIRLIMESILKNVYFSHYIAEGRKLLNEHSAAMKAVETKSDGQPVYDTSLLRDIYEIERMLDRAGKYIDRIKWFFAKFKRGYIFQLQELELGILWSRVNSHVRKLSDSSMHADVKKDLAVLEKKSRKQRTYRYVEATQERGLIPMSVLLDVVGFSVAEGQPRWIAHRWLHRLINRQELIRVTGGAELPRGVAIATMFSLLKIGKYGAQYGAELDSAVASGQRHQVFDVFTGKMSSNLAEATVFENVLVGIERDFARNPDWDYDKRMSRAIEGYYSLFDPETQRKSTREIGLFPVKDARLAFLIIYLSGAVNLPDLQALNRVLQHILETDKFGDLIARNGELTPENVEPLLHSDEWLTNRLTSHHRRIFRDILFELHLLRGEDRFPDMIDEIGKRISEFEDSPIVVLYGRHRPKEPTETPLMPLRRAAEKATKESWPGGFIFWRWPSHYSPVGEAENVSKQIRERVRQLMAGEKIFGRRFSDHDQIWFGQVLDKFMTRMKEMSKSKDKDENLRNKHFRAVLKGENQAAVVMNEEMNQTLRAIIAKEADQFLKEDDRALIDETQPPPNVNDQEELQAMDRIAKVEQEKTNLFYEMLTELVGKISSEMKSGHGLEGFPSPSGEKVIQALHSAYPQIPAVIDFHLTIMRTRNFQANRNPVHVTITEKSKNEFGHIPVEQHEWSKAQTETLRAPIDRLARGKDFDQKVPIIFLNVAAQTENVKPLDESEFVDAALGAFFMTHSIVFHEGKQGGTITSNPHGVWDHMIQVVLTREDISFVRKETKKYLKEIKRTVDQNRKKPARSELRNLSDNEINLIESARESSPQVRAELRSEGESNWSDMWGKTLGHPTFIEDWAKRHSDKLGDVVVEVAPSAFPATRSFQDKKVLMIDIGAPKSTSRISDNHLLIQGNIETPNEIEDERLSEAKATLRISKDAQNLDALLQGQVDSIILPEILNYVDFKNVISRVSKWLKPGGHLFVMNMPNYGINYLFSPNRPKDNRELLNFIKSLGFSVASLEPDADERQMSDTLFIWLIAKKIKSTQEDETIGESSRSELRRDEIPPEIEAAVARTDYQVVLTDLANTLISDEPGAVVSKEIAGLIEGIRSLVKQVTTATGRDLDSTMTTFTDLLSPYARSGQFLYTEGGSRASRFSKKGELKEKPVYVKSMDEEQFLKELRTIIENSWSEVVSKSASLEAPIKQHELLGRTLMFKLIMPNHSQDVRDRVSNLIRSKLAANPKFKDIKVYPSPRSITITRADKGDAARHLVAAAKAKPNQVLIIGDSELDDPMFRAIDGATKIYVGETPYPNMPADVIHFPIHGPKGTQIILQLIFKAMFEEFRRHVMVAVSKEGSREFNEHQPVSKVESRWVNGDYVDANAAWMQAGIVMVMNRLKEELGLDLHDLAKAIHVSDVLKLKDVAGDEEFIKRFIAYGSARRTWKFMAGGDDFKTTELIGMWADGDSRWLEENVGEIAEIIRKIGRKTKHPIKDHWNDQGEPYAEFIATLRALPQTTKQAMRSLVTLPYHLGHDMGMVEWYFRDHHLKMLDMFWLAGIIPPKKLASVPTSGVIGQPKGTVGAPMLDVVSRAIEPEMDIKIAWTTFLATENSFPIVDAYYFLKSGLSKATDDDRRDFTNPLRRIVKAADHPERVLDMKAARTFIKALPPKDAPVFNVVGQWNYTIFSDSIRIENLKTGQVATSSNERLYDYFIGVVFHALYTIQTGIEELDLNMPNDNLWLVLQGFLIGRWKSEGHITFIYPTLEAIAYDLLDGSRLFVDRADGKIYRVRPSEPAIEIDGELGEWFLNQIAFGIAYSNTAVKDMNAMVTALPPKDQLFATFDETIRIANDNGKKKKRSELRSSQGMPLGVMSGANKTLTLDRTDLPIAVEFNNQVIGISTTQSADELAIDIPKGSDLFAFKTRKNGNFVYEIKSRTNRQLFVSIELRDASLLFKFNTDQDQSYFVVATDHINLRHHRGTDSATEIEMSEIGGFEILIEDSKGLPVDRYEVAAERGGFRISNERGAGSFLPAGIGSIGVNDYFAISNFGNDYLLVERLFPYSPEIANLRITWSYVNRSELRSNVSYQINLSQVADRSHQALAKAILSNTDFISKSLQSLFPGTNIDQIKTMVPFVKGIGQGLKTMVTVEMELDDGKKQTMAIVAIAQEHLEPIKDKRVSERDPDGEFSPKFGVEADIQYQESTGAAFYKRHDYHVFSRAYLPGTPLSDLTDALEKLIGIQGRSGEDGLLYAPASQHDLTEHALGQLVLAGILTDPERLEIMDAKNRFESSGDRAVLHGPEEKLRALLFKLDQEAIRTHFKFYKKTQLMQSDPRRNNVIFRVGPSGEWLFKLIDFDYIFSASSPTTFAAMSISSFEIFEPKIDSVRPWVWTYLGNKTGFFDAILDVYGGEEGLQFLSDAQKGLEGDRSKENVLLHLNSYLRRSELRNQLSLGNPIAPVGWLGPKTRERRDQPATWTSEADYVNVQVGDVWELNGEKFTVESIHPEKQRVQYVRDRSGILKVLKFRAWKGEAELLEAVSGIPRLLQGRVLVTGEKEKGNYVLLLDYSGEKTLEDYSTDSFDQTTRIELLLEILEALKKIREKGFILYDVKPGNIVVNMINSKPDATVVDFGGSTKLSDFESPEKAKSTEEDVFIPKAAQLVTAWLFTEDTIDLPVKWRTLDEIIEFVQSQRSELRNLTVKDLIELIPTTRQFNFETLKFSDSEIQELTNWLSPAGQNLLPHPTLFRKLMHLLGIMRIEVWIKHDKTIKEMLETWEKLIAVKWDVEPNSVEALVFWLVRSEINVGEVSESTLSEFMNVYLADYGANGGGRLVPKDNFGFFLPTKGKNSEEKLQQVIANIKRSQELFSSKFVKGYSYFSAQIPETDFYLGVTFGSEEDRFRIRIYVGERERRWRGNAGIFFQITIDVSGEDLEIITMKGFEGKEQLVNEKFLKQVGLKPGRALLLAAVLFAKQKQFRNIVGTVDPWIANHRGAKLNYRAIYKGFGLRKKGEKGDWSSVQHLIDLTDDRLAQNDEQAKGILKIREAFFNLTEKALSDTRRSELRRINANAEDASGGVSASTDRNALLINSYLTNSNITGKIIVSLSELKQQPSLVQAINNALQANPESPIQIAIIAENFASGLEAEREVQKLFGALDIFGKQAGVQTKPRVQLYAQDRLGVARELSPEQAYSKLIDMVRIELGVASGLTTRVVAIGNRDLLTNVKQKIAKIITETNSFTLAELLIATDNSDQYLKFADEFGIVTPTAAYVDALTNEILAKALVESAA